LLKNAITNLPRYRAVCLVSLVHRPPKAQRRGLWLIRESFRCQRCLGIHLKAMA
jgi:hypothetical protein